MIDTLENGRLRLQDLRTKIKSLKVKWIKNIMDENYKAPWKSYISSKINMTVNKLPFYNLNANDYPTLKDNFYSHLFKTWSELKFHIPKNNEQVCREIIWHNSNILIGNKPAYYKQWENKGFNFIQDLLNEQGQLAKKEQLENKYNLTIKFLEYESLIAALPASWKTMLTNSNNNLGYHIFYDCKIYIKDQGKKYRRNTYTYRRKTYIGF
jgi:hypothetical protein